MTKKGSKPPSRAKGTAKRNKATRSAKGAKTGPSIPDLTDALAAAMASLRAAQISRLLGDAIPAGLSDHAESCQDAAGRKMAGKARKAGKQSVKAKKRAMKKARQDKLAGGTYPQIDDPGTRLPKVA